jgi:predicted TIM-barrel fold metal-dependent hydrolase
MFPRHGHIPNAARLHITVTDVDGVQRVLTLLTGRRHAFTRFEAEEAGAGRWALRLDLITDPERLALLATRLHRLPTVLDVDTHWGAALSATA